MIIAMNNLRNKVLIVMGIIMLVCFLTIGFLRFSCWYSFMCYYRAGLWAEIQGKEIYLILFCRIGYWDRMGGLYAFANKVNVNQSNMKLNIY